MDKIYVVVGEGDIGSLLMKEKFNKCFFTTITDAMKYCIKKNCEDDEIYHVEELYKGDVNG